MQIQGWENYYSFKKMITVSYLTFLCKEDNYKLGPS